MAYSVKMAKSGLMWYVMEDAEIVWVSVVKAAAYLKCKELNEEDQSSLEAERAESLASIHTMAKSVVIDTKYTVIRKSKESG